MHMCVLCRRKITYKQFQEALKLVAEKKYPGKEGAFDELQAIILKSKGPAVHATVSLLKRSNAHSPSSIIT